MGKDRHTIPDSGFHSGFYTLPGVFRLVVQKLRRESTHARPFGGDFELKMLRMRGFSSQFLDIQHNMAAKSVVLSTEDRQVVGQGWLPLSSTRSSPCSQQLVTIFGQPT